jgi:hypothetical protein
VVEPEEPEVLTVPAVYPTTTVQLAPGSTADVVGGMTQVMLGGVPVWGTLVGPGEVEVTGVRLALEIRP